MTFTYLTQKQWTTIKYLKENNPTKEKEINSIIYNHYKNWASNKAYQFKKFHFFKCKEIKQEELNLYALFGLQKAIQNYRPIKNNNAAFSMYASKYIIGELFEGITELHPITTLSKMERKKSYNKRNSNLIKCQLMTNVDDDFFDVLYYNNLQYNNDIHNVNSIHYNDCANLWKKINSMEISTITKKIINLKYSFDFNNKNSNLKVANILGYSEEYIRTNIIEFKKYFLEVIKK
jgi:hypothetical protein